MPDPVLRDHLILLFFSALFISLWLTPQAIRLSFRIDAVDHPGERKVHRKAVSRLGGLAMVAGLFLPLLFFQEIDRTLVAFLAGALVASATGFLDDVWRIRPGIKFFGEIAASAIFVFGSGVSLASLGDFAGVGEVSPGLLAPAVTIFCMVGVMNALNLSDGLDGLAGGISAIAGAFLGIFAILGEDWTSVAILASLLGALFGFLRYNTYPATLFMGDTGSVLLGYSLSAVTVILVQADGIGIRLSPVMVAAVLALPIMDTLLVMLRRIRHGENPFHPDKTHLHHRLLSLGLPHAAVVPILYVSSALFGFQAWALHTSPEPVQFAAVLGLGAVVYGTLFVVQRTGYRWGGAQDKVSSRNGGLHDFMAPLLGKSVRFVGAAIAVGLLLPAFLVKSVPRETGVIALAAGGFIAVLFPWKGRESRSGVCYGLMYAACASLLAILQVLPEAPAGMPEYLAVLSVLVVGWVILKMKYRGHREIVLLSAFEILLIGVSLCIPLVMIPALGMGDDIRRTTLAAVLEGIAFLMVFKILIRRKPGRNRVIAGAFLAALLLIAAKGFLGSPAPGRPLASRGAPRTVTGAVTMLGRSILEPPGVSNRSIPRGSSPAEVSRSKTSPPH